MKRIKAAGLGLALFAGVGQPAEPPVARAAAPGEEAVWLPARRPAPPPTAPAQLPLSVRAAAADPLPAETVPVAARIPDASSAPAGPRRGLIPRLFPQTAPSPVEPIFANAAQPIPAPRPVAPTVPAPLPAPTKKPDPMPAPPAAKPAPTPPPDMYAAPRPGLWARPAAVELPTAPPELLGMPPELTVPGKKGVFGSPQVRISRDYPTLRELLGHDGAAVSEPATDRAFLSVEYLLWWVRDGNIPVLASTSGSGGFGFLNEAGTVPLLGPGGFGPTNRSGVRVRGGFWFEDGGCWGVDGSLFVLGRRTESAFFDPQVYPTITRPILAPNPPAPREFGEVVSRPGFSRGSLAIDHDSYLWGADLNARHALCRTCDSRTEVFAGFRHLNLSEGLRATETITSLGGANPDPAGTLVVVQDKFEARNWFYGGQVGGVAEHRWGRFAAEVRGSVAIGWTHQQLDIEGFQVRQRPGDTPANFVGGLLAAGPNLGKFTRDQFAVVPEATVNLGAWVTPNVKLSVGYNFIYWSNVVRPGEAIDRVVDVTFVPNPPMNVASSGTNRPQPQFRQSDFWAQGVQFGIEGRW